MQLIYNVTILDNYLIIITTCKNNNITYKYFMFNKKITSAKILNKKIVLI